MTDINNTETFSMKAYATFRDGVIPETELLTKN